MSNTTERNPANWKSRRRARTGRVGLMQRMKEGNGDRERTDKELPLFDRLREELVEELTRKAKP